MIKKLKIILLILSVLACMLLTGCGIRADAKANVEHTFRGRVELNYQIIEGLYSSGLISEKVRDQAKEAVEGSATAAISSLKLDSDKNSGKIDKNLLNCIVTYVGMGGGKDHDAIGHFTGGGAGDPWCETKDEKGKWVPGYTYLSCYFAGGKVELDSSTGTALQFVDTGTAKQINDNLRYKIYVLNDNVDLAEVSAALKQVDKNDDKTFNPLQNYFRPLTDESGGYVTLLPDNDEYQLVKITSPDGNSVDVMNGDTFNIEFSRSTGAGSIPYIEQKPGYDLVLSQNGCDVMQFRLFEFNQNVYETIVKQLGLNDGTFLIRAESNSAYLITYPVGYVSGYTVTDNRYEADIVQSKMRVNLYTGKIFKEYDDGSTKAMSDKDPYMKFDTEDYNTSSFAVCGTVSIATSDDANGDDIWAYNLPYRTGYKYANFPRVVLLDYLEASYAPGIDKSSNLVLFGRKIRLIPSTSSTSSAENEHFVKKELAGLLSEPIGYYCSYDYANSTRSNSENIYLNNIADYKTLQNTGTPYIKTLPNDKSIELKDDAAVQAFEAELSARAVYNVEDLTELESITVGSIETSFLFPSRSFDSQDHYSNLGNASNVEFEADYDDDRPWFYCMATCNQFGSSGLLTYILSEDSIDSTNWWNSWLAEHNFKYFVDYNGTLGYLKDNYSYELADNDILVINTDTIGKIQSELDKEKQLDTIYTARTIFKVLGVILISYGVLLMLAWVVDTNVDLGFNVLERITLGKLVAVASEKEIPHVAKEENGPKYVGLSSITMIAIGSICLGITVIMVDIIQIIILIIKAVGNFARGVVGALGGK